MSRCTLRIEILTSMEWPSTERYKFLSAMTKPTLKNTLEAGRKGSMMKAKESRTGLSDLKLECRRRGRSEDTTNQARRNQNETVGSNLQEPREKIKN